MLRAGVRGLCTTRIVRAARPSIQSISALRKAVPGTSMLKAREALAATRTNDTDQVEAAIQWLEAHRAADGAKREAKVASVSYTHLTLPTKA